MAVTGAVAAAVLALGVIERPPAVATDSTSAARAGRIVVSPRPGQRVRGNVVTIRVRARDRLGDLRASLNGRSIARDFGAARHGVRALEVSISHGLRDGPNVLRVRARRRDGTWLTRTLRFFVAHRGVDVGAGRDVRAVVGTRYRLQGVLAEPGAAGGARAHIRWRLRGAPRRSLLGKRTRGPRRPARAGALGSGGAAPQR